jgi:hypothetical protein
VYVIKSRKACQTTGKCIYTAYKTFWFCSKQCSVLTNGIITGQNGGSKSHLSMVVGSNPILQIHVFSADKGYKKDNFYTRRDPHVARGPLYTANWNDNWGLNSKTTWQTSATANTHRNVIPTSRSVTAVEAGSQWPAARSEAWTVFARSNTGIVGSKPIRGMEVCVRFFCACVVRCVGSGLATAWALVEGVLLTVYIGLRNWKSGQGPTKGCRAIDERMNEHPLKIQQGGSLFVKNCLNLNFAPSACMSLSLPLSAPFEPYMS